MSFLTRSILEYVEYGQLKLNLFIPFDNVLTFYDMMSDNGLNSVEKVLIGLEILLEDDSEIDNLSMQEKYSLFSLIVEKLTGEDIKNNNEKDNENEVVYPPKDNSVNDSDNKPSKDFDYNIDGELIYASFMMDYGIDLINEQGTLHWDKFKALFNGLSDKTPFKSVVKIRTMKVPKPNRHNQEYRNEILEMKRKHSLDNNDIGTALNEVSSFFKKTAKKEGDK